jgi:citrate synthase
MIKALPKDRVVDMNIISSRLEEMAGRISALFHSNVSSDKGGEVRILGESLVSFVKDRSLSEIALSMFLGHNPKSNDTVEFFDLSIKLLVDHGPQVSGSVNTMISARAGVDLPAALATGLLTVGPRFGGAIDQAARNWISAISESETPDDFVERFATNKQNISGIGHKKYRIDNPDPRVSELLESNDTGGKYTLFAKEVARITTNKKAQLILNVDGAIAALLLDIFSEKEGYSEQQLLALVETGFCNAIFVYARSVGFIAHYLDQKRQDEGLFRLPDSLVG